MSYNDSYGGGGGGGEGYDDRQGRGYGGGREDEYGGRGSGGGGGGYGGRQDEYGGGGGRGSDNYYNQSSDFSSSSGGGGRDERYGGGGYGGGGGAGPGNNLNFQGGGAQADFDGAMSHAQQHGSGHRDEEGMFSSVLNHLKGNQSRISEGDVDEQGMVSAHQSMYGNQSGGGHGSETVGAGAAMQAFKMFTGSGQGSGSGGGGGGGGQNAFVGMAMGQASKLFDQQSSQGNLDPSASKESAVQKAGEMAFKMYMKGQMGAGGSGGTGGLMSMASKFL